MRISDWSSDVCSSDLRAHDWRSKLDIARVATEGAPASGRAWTQLCASRFDAGGGAIPGNPLLDEAIATCSKGADAAPNSLNNLTLLVVLKTLRGDVGPQEIGRESCRERVCQYV